MAVEQLFRVDHVKEVELSVHGDSCLHPGIVGGSAFPYHNLLEENKYLVKEKWKLNSYRIDDDLEKLIIEDEEDAPHDKTKEGNGKKEDTLPKVGNFTIHINVKCQAVFKFVYASRRCVKLK